MTDHSTVSIQNGGQTLPCGPRQFRGPIYWNAHASSSFQHAHWGYKTFSKRIRRYSVDGRNDTKTISVDANLFWKPSKAAPLSFENRLVKCGQGLSVICVNFDEWSLERLSWFIINLVWLTKWLRFVMTDLFIDWGGYREQVCVCKRLGLWGSNSKTLLKLASLA